MARSKKQRSAMTEAQLHERVEALKADAFGDAAHIAKVTTTGSTISETTRMSVPLLAKPELLRTMALPWTEHRNLTEQLIRRDLEQSRICPGRNDPRCCQATVNQTCFPKWVEREDREWYALKINIGLSLVNDRLKDVGPLAAALAADDAFELGCLFTEARDKFGWDEHAQAGKKSYDGGAKGRQTLKKTTQEEDATVFSMVQSLIKAGKPRMAAYKEVAKDTHVSWETVRKQYARYQKK